MDPRRLHRVLRFLRNLLRPSSLDTVDRTLWALTWLALAAVSLLAVTIWGLADVWWPATLLLFGGRWIFLVPLFPLVIGAAQRDRALLVPLVLAVLIMIGPVMGFRTGWRSWLTFGRSDDLVVASFNVAGGESLSQTPGELLDRWDADIAVFQECGRPFAEALRLVPGRNTHEYGSLCLSTRLQFAEAARMQRRAIDLAGGSGLVSRYLLVGPDGPINVTNVHLETPRAGLELIRSGRLAEGVDRLKEKSMMREIELRRARAWAAQGGPPAIVMGDFNTPPESRVYRAEWKDWVNAFSVAGFGLGATRLNGWIRARIDHVLLDENWTVVDAWVGDAVGSDHRPTLARIRPAR